MKKQENEMLDRTRGRCVTVFGMRTADVISTKLRQAFSPTSLTVEDESARHEGHAGARPEGETHFNVRIVSPVFAGLSRVERQRRVYAVLADELKAKVHALALLAQTPEEAEKLRS